MPYLPPARERDIVTGWLNASPPESPSQGPLPRHANSALGSPQREAGGHEIAIEPEHRAAPGSGHDREAGGVGIADVLIVEAT